jgi:hypothetical protein
VICDDKVVLVASGEPFHLGTLSSESTYNGRCGQAAGWELETTPFM